MLRTPALRRKTDGMPCPRRMADHLFRLFRQANNRSAFLPDADARNVIITTMRNLCDAILLLKERAPGRIEDALVLLAILAALTSSALPLAGRRAEKYPHP